MSKTQAERVADLLDNDGTHWTDREGRTLEEIAVEMGASLEFGRWTPTDPDALWQDQDSGYYVEISIGEATTNNAVRYVFSDGSAIVEAGACWDIEGDKPFVMAGA